MSTSGGLAARIAPGAARVTPGATTPSAPDTVATRDGIGAAARAASRSPAMSPFAAHTTIVPTRAATTVPAAAPRGEPFARGLLDVARPDMSGFERARQIKSDPAIAGSRLVLSGRGEPPVRVARLRAEGRIVEIGPGDLSLTRAEASSLLRAAGVTLDEQDVAELHRRTEGWPAGLYLAALYLREGGSLPGAAVSFGGDDRLVSEYMESEFLDRISARQRVFLTRTAVLERMSGPLCDAVLDLTESATTLADLARSNLLLVPLDRRGLWYRYHHLFRDMLLAELHRRESGLIPLLRRRAAAWCLRNDLSEEALEYSIAAGDVEAVAGLVEQLVIQTYRQGRGATLRRWLAWLDERGGIAGHPMVAVMAASLSATMGRPAEAERFADMVDRWQDRGGHPTDEPFGEASGAVARVRRRRKNVTEMPSSKPARRKRAADAALSLDTSATTSARSPGSGSILWFPS